jgi:riboflavin kinase/FMN adenylyltransferase
MTSTPPTPGTPCVIAPGNHDGVHLGHQALVRRACTYARAHGLRAVALTFDPHPMTVLAPARAPTALTTIERRTELLRLAGADDVVVEKFTPELANLAPDDFLHGLMRRGARALVVGPDFRFGKERAGDQALLERFGRAHGLHVMVEPPVLVDGARVSSSAVREAVAAGDVARATVLLGHVPELTGTVVLGQQRGRTLGFPTANLECEPVLQPADGVYAVVARVLGDGAPARAGVLNIGVRPTVAGGRSIEAHVFDFDGDLYGARLRVGFVARLRGEQKFSSLDALKTQIGLDCEAARSTVAASDERLWAWI